MALLYSAKFTVGAQLLPWLVLGVFGRVVMWPMGFVFLAKGAKGHFAAIETVLKIPRVLFVIILVKEWGLVGAAVAWPINYIINFCIVYPVTRGMIDFRYQRSSALLFFKTSCLIALSFLSVWLLPQFWGTGIAVLALFLGTIFSIRSLLQCLDAEHRIVRVARKLPLVGRISDSNNRN
jgi:PST family polysaccharide transporter